MEQDRLELDSARLSLYQSLQDTEMSRGGIEAELQTLRAERVKLQDKVTQVGMRPYTTDLSLHLNTMSPSTSAYQEY